MLCSVGVWLKTALLLILYKERWVKHHVVSTSRTVSDYVLLCHTMSHESYKHGLKELCPLTVHTCLNMSAGKLDVLFRIETVQAMSLEVAHGQTQVI